MSLLANHKPGAIPRPMKPTQEQLGALDKEELVENKAHYLITRSISSSVAKLKPKEAPPPLAKPSTSPKGSPN